MTRREPTVRIAMAAPIPLSVVSTIVFSMTFLPAVPQADSQAAEQQVPAISWAEVEKAIEDHPAISKSKAMKAAAAAELKKAGEYPNPAVVAAAGPALPHGSDDVLVAWSVELDVPLEWIAERAYLKKAALAGIESCGFVSEALRLEVERELRTMFVSVACDQALVVALRQEATHLAGIEATWAARVDLGDERKAVLSRIKAERAKADLAVSKAGHGARANRERLALWLGWDLTSDLVVEMDVAQIAPVPDIGEVVAKVSEKNPLVLAAGFEIDKAKALVGAQKHAAFPDLSIGAFFQQEPGLTAFGGKLTMTLPLWNWNKGGVDLAIAGEMQAQSDEALVVLELTGKAIDSHSDLEAAAEQAGMYEKEVLPMLRDAASDVEKAWAMGDADLMDLLDARRSLAASTVEYVEVLRLYHLAAADIEALTAGGVE